MQILVSKPESVNLCVCVDRPYLGPFSALLKSLQARLQPEQNIDVFAIYSDLTTEERASAVKTAAVSGRISVSWLDVSGHSASRHFRPFNHISKSGWNRILLGSLLPDSVQRVLYLDCDILITGDLGALWRTPIQDNMVLCAVQDARTGRFGDVNSPVFSRYNHAADTPYFNSGVMLINLDAWRAEGIEEQLSTLIENYAGECEWGDQCALNCVLPGKWQSLEAKWNLQPLHLAAMQPDEFNLSAGGIIHFVGKIKPWHAWCLHPFANEYRDQSRIEVISSRSRRKLISEMLLDGARLMRNMLEIRQGEAPAVLIRRCLGQLTRSTSHMPRTAGHSLSLFSVLLGSVWYLRNRLLSSASAHHTS